MIKTLNKTKTFDQIYRHFRQFGATLFLSIFHQRGRGVQIFSNHDFYSVELWWSQSLNKSLKNWQNPNGVETNMFLTKVSDLVQNRLSLNDLKILYWLQKHLYKYHLMSMNDIWCHEKSCDMGLFKYLVIIFQPSGDPLPPLWSGVIIWLHPKAPNRT